MKATCIAIASLTLVVLLLTGGMMGTVSAANGPALMDRIKLETGHTDEWNGGDYVAVNMTDGISFAWFGVIYGTEAEPAPITIVSANLRYLGGAQVVNEKGDTMIKEVPIPVLTAFGQSLFALLEFDDSGYDVPVLGSYGAGNGLFDFSGPNLWSETGSFEPVYKYVDLRRAWDLSEIVSNVDEVEQTKSYTFSLSAEDISYAKVWDEGLGAYRNGTEEDGVLERLQFTFHIDASAEAVTRSVPFYKVTIDGGHVTDSEGMAPRNYTATSVQCGVKYDHEIQGWDAYGDANGSKLMLENVVAFGMVIPEIVEEWYDAQFIEENIAGGNGSVMFTTDQGTRSITDQDELPDQSVQVMSNTEISSNDNWERCGNLTWVSEVSVDGRNESMRYQVHAGDRSSTLLGAGIKGHDGHLKLLILLGGYIYPIGSDVIHDPSISAEAMQIGDDFLRTILNFIGTVVLAVVIGLSALMLVVVLLIRRSNRKKNEKFDYRTPPGYRP